MCKPSRVYVSFYDFMNRFHRGKFRGLHWSGVHSMQFIKLQISSLEEGEKNYYKDRKDSSILPFLFSKVKSELGSDLVRL